MNKKVTLDSVLERLQKENTIRQITNAGQVRGGAVPEPKDMSEAVNSLTTYMAVKATGAEYKGPSLKR